MSLATGDNPRAGQTTATTTAAALGSQACNSVLVQCDPGASNNVLVGDSANQYVALQPGQSLSIPCSNISQVYVKTASGSSTVNFLSVY
jgi:hypothetical protein